MISLPSGLVALKPLWVEDRGNLNKIIIFRSYIRSLCLSFYDKKVHELTTSIRVGRDFELD